MIIFLCEIVNKYNGNCANEVITLPDMLYGLRELHKTEAEKAVKALYRVGGWGIKHQHYIESATAL